MILAGPDVAAGRVCSTNVSLVDLALTFSRNVMLDVAYDKPGSLVLDRINMLYQARIGGELFPSGVFDFQAYGRPEITKAKLAPGHLLTSK